MLNGEVMARLFLLFFLVSCSQESKSLELGYTDGVYQCCAQGEDTSCCVDEEPGMCFEYGGYYGDCRQEGELLEGKIICGLCCEGLQQKEPMIETDDGPSDYPDGCGPGEAPPSILVCVACGDGICGSAENRCICPEDCTQ